MDGRGRLKSWTILAFALTLLNGFFVRTSTAAFINFENCVPETRQQSDVLLWVPLWFNAHFNSTHNLNITTYGNVTGRVAQIDNPPRTSPLWHNDNFTNGKIVNVSEASNRYTTLYTRFKVLSYTAYDAPATAFYKSLVNTTLPIAPAFNESRYNPYDLPAWSVAHDLSSSYAFATIVTTLRIQSGDDGAPLIACVSAAITPDLGATLSGVLTYLPLLVLVFVGFATIFAATLSPWGTLNPFRWTSNHGRDEDLLRLVTPGFGDCLQYIQFIILVGSLTLTYPGYFQPVVSKVGWSALMFNESFYSQRYTQNPIDGVYFTNGTYGLTRMSQLIGMGSVRDVWGGTVVWTLVIIAAVFVLCQAGFLGRWIARKVTGSSAEDLRSKNWPFTAGMVVRIVCNYFILPLVALSLFQLVNARGAPGYLTALSAILLVLILAFLVYILRLIFSTKPRAHLFDDLPTVLLYGPLYNTYSDDKAPFALIPVLITFMRGVAIGAVQPSGIAQLVILAICEVVLILMLHAARPFQSPTSMNAYHTFFSAVRLITIVLLVAFVPALGISEASRGYIGYVVLLLHAIVLIFGFFLNAVQTIIEVSFRLAGAGGQDESGRPTRGGLRKAFGVRQLSRRRPKPGFRHSMASDAAILTNDHDIKSLHQAGRARSISASSAILLAQHQSPSSRASAHFDQFSAGDPETDTPGLAASSMYSFLPGGAGTPPIGAPRRPTVELVDPYYRAPRPRRPTVGEGSMPGARNRGSAGSADLIQASPERADRRDSTGRPLSFSPTQTGTPAPAYMRHRDDSDPNINDPRHANVDYAIREVDFYYGVRGPALSSQPTRKLKTGPADPVGPVSSATGWFKGIFGRKTKDNSKGFEVVRSSRMPPARFAEAEATPDIEEGPYEDSPINQQQQDTYLPGQRTRSNEEERELGIDPPAHAMDDAPSIDESIAASVHVPEIPPMLDPIQAGDAIELPSRFGSRASHSNPAVSRQASAVTPNVPRRSSRRNSNPSTELLGFDVGEAAAHNQQEAISRVPFHNTRDSVVSDITEDVTGTSSRDGGVGMLDNLSSATRRGTERATSYGRVQQYRASDGIRGPVLGNNAHAASSAELVTSHSSGDVQ